MNANLTLSKTTAYSTSAWNGTAHEHVEYINGLQHVYNTYTYSTPDTTSNDEVKVTVPSSLNDVTFNSVAFTYDVSQTQSGGSRTLIFKDTGKAVTNAAILARLRAGDTSFYIQFYYRAAGGTGGSGIHYATCSWKNLKITVDYTPNSKIHGYATASDNTSIYYGIDADNLAQTESMPVRISFTAKKAVASVTFSVEGNNGGSGSLTVTKTASQGGAWDNTFTFTLPEAQASEWSARISSATDITILITYTDSTTAQGGATTALKLVRERNTPTLSLAFTDTEGVYGDYGVYVQNQSALTATPTVSLDTGADSNNAVTAMTLTFGGTVFSTSGSSFSLGTVIASGTVYWELEVTDTYGMTGVINGSISVTAWAPPYLTSFEAERYSTGVDTGGNPVYYPDDGGVDIRVTLAGGVSPVNGQNAWTLVMSATNGTNTYTRTIMTGTDGQTISLNQDRSVFDATLSATSDWAVTLTLSDGFTSAVYDGIVIPKAGAIFNIEKTGVAVGMRSTGTLAEPLFQVAYPAELASISKLNGKAYDTGWVDMSSYLKPGLVTAGDCYFRRIGKTVFVMMSVTLKGTLNSSTWLDISQTSKGVAVPLPEEWWPPMTTYLPSFSQTPGGWIRITAAGYFGLRNQTGSQVKGTDAGGSWWVTSHGCYSVT